MPIINPLFYITHCGSVSLLFFLRDKSMPGVLGIKNVEKLEEIIGWVDENREEKMMGARLCRDFDYFFESDGNPLGDFSREVIWFDFNF